MIVTKTNQIDGKHIIEYRDIVFGEVITGINMFKDMAAGFRNMFGGRGTHFCPICQIV